jgi:hypothetical protein
VSDLKPTFTDQELLLLGTALSEIWMVAINNGDSKEILNVLFRPDLLVVQRKIVNLDLNLRK